MHFIRWSIGKIILRSFFSLFRSSVTLHHMPTYTSLDEVSKYMTIFIKQFFKKTQKTKWANLYYIGNSWFYKQACALNINAAYKNTEHHCYPPWSGDVQLGKAPCTFSKWVGNEFTPNTHVICTCLTVFSGGGGGFLFPSMKLMSQTMIYT